MKDMNVSRISYCYEKQPDKEYMVVSALGSEIGTIKKEDDGTFALFLKVFNRCEKLDQAVEVLEQLDKLSFSLSGIISRGNNAHLL